MDNHSVNGHSEKKEFILDKATQLFASQGYAATSVRQIATAADINVSMIAYYFGGKEGLYQQLIDHHIELFRQHLVKKLNSEVDIEKRLRVFVDTLMESLLEKADILRIVTRELVTDNKNIQTFLGGMIPSFTKTFELLYEGMDISDFEHIDTTEAIYEIFMILAPIYFYFIAQPIVDNVILLTDKDKERFRQFLIDDIYKRVIKIPGPQTVVV